MCNWRKARGSNSYNLAVIAGFKPGKHASLAAFLKLVQRAGFEPTTTRVPAGYSRVLCRMSVLYLAESEGFEPSSPFGGLRLATEHITTLSTFLKFGA